MSTRSHIRIKQSDGKIYPCMIYKHSDGYPEGILPFLKSFLKKFVKDRGDDPEYCLAQIIRHWAFEEDEYCKKWIKESKKDGRGYIPSNYARGFLGWGVCLTSDPHGDIEYVYTVDLKNGTVSTKHV